ncbi:copper type II ascorbate-dependent monooxygenase [Fragilaria crotonensis]|nr:copper type II ascorbate-dependent monooxygenase [Fragilaria crotonensis]
MYSAESNELVDSYVLADLVTPMPDDCQSWTLVNSVTQDGFIIFEAYRLLDTGDTQDRPITDDSNELVAPRRVIAAWGDNSFPMYHGLTNRAKGTIRFMGTTSMNEMELFQKSVALEAEGHFTISAKNHTITAVETKYDHFCFSSTTLTDMGVPIDEDIHIIGMEPVLDPRSRRYVHHFVVYGTNDPWNSGSNCSEFPGFEMVYVWTPGDLPLKLPDNVGALLGRLGFRSFRLQIHYNNPELDTDKIDNSGVRFYYSSKKRQHDLGVFQTGDPWLGLSNMAVSNNTALSEHTFDCSNSCSALFLNESVTVIREHLHMHKAGISMTNSQSRNNQVVRMAEVQFWDFDQQGNLGVIQAPFTIQPGDSFRTTCNYNAKNGEVFGFGSSQEMCIAFLFYYPRKVISSDYGDIPFMCGPNVFDDLLPECDASWTRTDLEDSSELKRTFGLAASSCPKPTPANFPSFSAKALATPSAPVSAATDQMWYCYMIIPTIVAWVGGHTFV